MCTERALTEMARGNIESQPVKDVRFTSAGRPDDWIRRGNSRPPPGEIGIPIAIQRKSQSECKSNLFGLTQAVTDSVFARSRRGMPFRRGHPDIESHPRRTDQLLVTEIRGQRVLNRNPFSFDRKGAQVDRWQPGFNGALGFEAGGSG